jgi:hypothetical protein
MPAGSPRCPAEKMVLFRLKLDHGVGIRIAVRFEKELPNGWGVRTGRPRSRETYRCLELNFA